MWQEIRKALESEFEKANERLARDLARIRTGRANATMLDDIKVDYYGQATAITQIASVKIPEPRLITITPWEKGVLGQIEKAIHASDLGLAPNNDGTMIRLVIPPLTGERRQELAKSARKIAEDAKIVARNGRRDANEALKKAQKDSKITEDELRKHTDEVQKLTDAAIAKIDATVAKKEKEITEI